MIAIVSNQNDQSSKEVKEWIHYYGSNCNFIDNLSHEPGINIFLDNEKSSVEIADNSISSIWFRRKPDLKRSVQQNEQIGSHIAIETKEFLNSLFSLFLKKDECPTIGTNILYNDFSNISKTYSLLAAKESGLKIPPTLITNRKKDLLRFCEKYENVICKPLHASIFIRDEESLDSFAMYASLMTEDILRQTDDSFYPCLFQKYIPKKIEIRSFFLVSKFYTAAIFSQNNSKTKVDFRNYDDNNPNRVVPYNLPKEIEGDLLKTFNKLGLNTGSADILLDPGGNYYFLEINPVGQFGMVSFPCNFYLEEKISLFLINNNEEKNFD